MAEKSVGPAPVPAPRSAGARSVPPKSIGSPAGGGGAEERRPGVLPPSSSRKRKSLSSCICCISRCCCCIWWRSSSIWPLSRRSSPSSRSIRIAWSAYCGAPCTCCTGALPGTSTAGVGPDENQPAWAGAASSTEREGRGTAVRRDAGCGRADRRRSLHVRRCVSSIPRQAGGWPAADAAPAAPLTRGVRPKWDPRSGAGSRAPIGRTGPDRSGCPGKGSRASAGPITGPGRRRRRVSCRRC
ncbi:hypothetical protein A6302_04348 [Methylobrevis pamukkalensis]|uniref:Uncharacterized protein n=1 Tax=Methylobrevis pamukkalensis TaxID=1439726 RepID=A0A1E3GVA9_9HYPH|nr:hypothetical protein A6302_04348 [Methylobrevis pamukkalensis]